MENSIGWLLRRQYIPSKNTKASFINRLISNFSSSPRDEYQIHGEMGMPLPPFVARFSPDLLSGTMLGVADEDGHVQLIDTNKQKNESIIKEWSAHSNAVFDLAWIHKEAKLITASGDQTARLWDVEKAETVSIFRGHTCSLKSVAVQPSSTRVFLTGARDGNIMLWDTRMNMRNGFTTPTNTIRNAHVLPQKDIVTPSGKKRKSRRASMYNADSKQSVTSVVFQDNNTVVSSGACDGTLKFWDVRKNYTLHKTTSIAFHVIPFPGKGHRKHGYSSLVLNSSLSRLYAVCTNDIIYEYATANLSTQPVASYYGHLASSFYVKAALSPDDRFLLCGSGDNNAYIWRTDSPNSPPWMLKGHCGEVTSVAWSQSRGHKIVTCSDDNTFKIWRLFQDHGDHTNQNIGTCQLKQIDDKLKDISANLAVRDSEDVSKTPPHRRRCRPASLNLNSKTLTKCEPVMLTKEALSPICKTPDGSLDNAQSSTMTPKPTLRQKLLSVTPSNVMSPSLSSCTRKDPTTPRSSRSFMETWLKSPITPGGNINNAVNKVSASTKRLEDSDVQILPSQSSINCIQRTPEEKSDVDIKITPKVKIVFSHKSRRRKRATPSEDIKTLLLSTKRKRDSHTGPTGENQPIKLVKRDKKNGLAKEASSKIECELLKEKTEDFKKNVLKEQQRKSHKLRDLLDHAEDDAILD